MSCLDVTVSKFNSVLNTDSTINVNLLDYLHDDSHKDEILTLRTLRGEALKESKKKLHGITPSGLFHRRSESGLVEHSGLIQFDVDGKDNPYSMESLKHVIKQAPNVAYLGFSASGNGLWGIIPIQYPEHHKAHFRAIYQAFEKKGVIIDKAPSNVSSFRFSSFDSEPYFNHHAEVYTYRIADDKPQKIGRDNRTKVEELISKIQVNRIDITDGYENWLKIGFALAEEFGESGRAYFHRVSQWNEEYNSKGCDSQFNNCLRSNKKGISIASFFHECKQYGVTLNSMDKVHDYQIDSPLEAKYERATYGHNPFTAEIFNERGYPKDWDFISDDGEHFLYPL